MLRFYWGFALATLSFYLGWLPPLLGRLWGWYGERGRPSVVGAVGGVWREIKDPFGPPTLGEGAYDPWPENPAWGARPARHDEESLRKLGECPCWRCNQPF